MEQIAIYDYWNEINCKQIYANISLIGNEIINTKYSHESVDYFVFVYEFVSVIEFYKIYLIMS